jgi:hypothetical protein
MDMILADRIPHCFYYCNYYYTADLLPRPPASLPAAAASVVVVLVVHLPFERGSWLLVYYGTDLYLLYFLEDFLRDLQIEMPFDGLFLAKTELPLPYLKPPAAIFLPLADDVLRVLRLELAPQQHVEVLRLLHIEVESIYRFYVAVASLVLEGGFECRQVAAPL